MTMTPVDETTFSFKSARMADWVQKRMTEVEAGDLSPGVFNAMLLHLVDRGFAAADEGFVTKLRAEVKRCKTTTKPTQRGATMTTPKTTTPANLKGTKAGAVMNSARVKDASESLCSKRYSLKRADGSALVYGGRALETSSEHDLAVIGVYTKTVLRRQGVGVPLSEFERSLLGELVEKGGWVGTVGNTYFGGGPDGHVPNVMVKALLDDTISGGIEITPSVFDDAIVVKPLLNGQLAPFVDLKPVTGRRVKSGTMQNLTVAWGVPDGAAAPVFDTSSLIGPLDTPIFPVVGFVELGRDFEADTPVAIGTLVVEQYSERLKAELDRVIAVGNGTSEPLGIANTSGITLVQSDMGSAGPATVSDYEALMFTVPLQYRLSDMNACFISNDTSYARLSGIKVGPTDQRRVFGTQSSIGGTQQAPMYSAFGQPVRISPNLTNNKIVYGGLKKYRLYQRLGGEFFAERGGRTLTLSNKILMGVRARFGGQVADASAFALMTDAQD